MIGIPLHACSALSPISAQPGKLLADYTYRTGEQGTTLRPNPLSLATLSKFRVLEHVFTDVPADGSEDLALVLSACKFLDLLLVLQTQEFQM